MPKLRVQIPNETAPRELDLDRGEVTVGKNPERNLIVVADNRVSREHARIFRQGHGFVVEDRGSKNGTLLDGRSIPPHEPQRLNPGSVISLAGACTITFLAPEDSPQESIAEFAEQPIAESVLVRPAGQITTSAGPLTADPTAPPHALIDDLVRLQHLVEKHARRLNLLYDLGKSLSSVFSLEAIYQRATEALFQVTPADRCCILLKKEDVEDLIPVLVRARQDKTIVAGEKLLISRTVVKRVIEEKVSLSSFYAQSDEDLKDVPSILTQGIQSLMCAPLIGRGGVLGAIYADRQNPTETFTEDDLELLNAIAGETSIAVDNALSYEKLSREALARAAYGRFVPHHVVEQILAQPDSLRPGGSNQLATILFADIRDFTPLSERRRPEQVVQLLNTYFQAMTDVIFAHGGTLDKYIGDGLMALFGAPYTSDRDAVNAVKAAIEMQERVVGLRAELKSLDLPELGIGIGINTGEVTVGYIGSAQRIDYTAIGDAVNLAARLEHTAERGQIRISESTKEALGGQFRTSPLGSIVVKGRQEPVKVHEIVRD